MKIELTASTYEGSDSHEPPTPPLVALTPKTYGICQFVEIRVGREWAWVPLSELLQAAKALS